MSGKAKAIPDGFGTVSAHITVRGCVKAIEFYKKAFGAEEMGRMMMPDGQSVCHADLKLGNSRVMLNDEMPGGQCPVASPQTTGKVTAVMHLYVENCDAVYDRAVKAGATATMPLMDAFWGDRYGQVTDPFGHVWSIATHKQDLTPAQIGEGAKAFFASMGGKH